MIQVVPTEESSLTTYGRLAPEQHAALERAVAGQHVLDLGAGNLRLAETLAQLGAARVTAVDRCFQEGDITRAARTPRLLLARASFRDFVVPDDARVAFLSWPSTGLHYEYVEAGALLQILDRCDTVVLVSKNTDGLACGWPGLYTHLGARPILGYHPRRTNTLIVYGRGPIERPLRGEELAGISDRVAVAYDSLGEELS